MLKRIICSSMVVAFSAAAFAEILDRPTGIKIGQRMTLRPYVSASATYDSNVGGRNSDVEDDVMWTVSPNLALDYKAENWSLLLNAFYNYHAYCKKTNSNRHNQHSYGETLRWNWRNSMGTEKGWTLMLSESYHRMTMMDDITFGDGSCYTADRDQLQFQAGAQRRFNENWHSELNASYYYLNYDNDTSGTTAALYGWQRWTVGLSAGFAPSRWTDFIGNLGYQGYNQDNTGTTALSRDSQGYTAQVGIGSYMTDRISYRALVGWSRFEYANNTSSDDGFVYTLSGNWKIGETWNTMLMATAYYQPSEYQQASKSRTDAVSWGLTKSLIRGKLRASLDATYRHQTHEYVIDGYSNNDYAIDVATARLGFNYTLNRFFAFFAYGEYQRSWNDQSERRSGQNDYDRWRVTGGIRLTY